MTIAMCHISPEGIVLGVDSTSSFGVQAGGYHYFNHNQKLFELGEKSSVGVLTWGMGGLSNTSHRTLLAELADDIDSKKAKDIAEIADRWAALFWSAYVKEPLVQQFKTLTAKKPFDPTKKPADPDARTSDEEELVKNLTTGLVVGFCVGGYVLPDRTPKAYQILFDPILTKPPAPNALSIGWWSWGAPNMIQRLINGRDSGIKDLILKSGKWTGTDPELTTILNQYALSHPRLPIRDAVDFVYTCIYSTTKAIKFSNFHQICGGPIEIAVITSDRLFRWVRHKEWDVAIMEGA